MTPIMAWNPVAQQGKENRVDGRDRGSQGGSLDKNGQGCATGSKN